MIDMDMEALSEKEAELLDRIRAMKSGVLTVAVEDGELREMQEVTE